MHAHPCSTWAQDAEPTTVEANLVRRVHPPLNVTASTPSLPDGCDRRRNAHKAGSHPGRALANTVTGRPTRVRVPARKADREGAAKSRGCCLLKGRTGAANTWVGTCRYRLRVRIDDGDLSSVWSHRLAYALVGDLLPVRYDRADRSRVIIDGPAVKAKRVARLRELKDQAIKRGERELDQS